MANAILKVSKIEVIYHRISTAIQGVSFDVFSGSFFALIGANGAGKTTTLRAVSGFLGRDNATINDGEIEFEGEKITNLQPHKISRKGIILVPERKKVFETLTTQENIVILGGRSTSHKESVSRVYNYFPALKSRNNLLAGFLSGGERQMLAMGQALLCSPKLLLIDELSLGLAPMIVKVLIKNVLQMQKDFGLTVLMVEQNAAIALDIANYAAVMENGRVVFDGPPEKLRSHEDVREFYLGIKDNKERTYRNVKQYRRSRRWWG